MSESDPEHRSGRHIAGMVLSQMDPADRHRRRHEVIGRTQRIVLGQEGGRAPCGEGVARRKAGRRRHPDRWWIVVPRVRPSPSHRRFHGGVHDGGDDTAEDDGPSGAEPPPRSPPAGQPDQEPDEAVITEGRCAVSQSVGHRSAPPTPEHRVHPFIDGVDDGPGHPPRLRGRRPGLNAQSRRPSGVTAESGAEGLKAAPVAQRRGLRPEVLVLARPLDGRPHRRRPLS